LDHLDWINDELTFLAEAFGEPLTEQRQEIYCGGLADIQQDRLQVAFRRALYELKWFPKLAELRQLAGASIDALADGRPGPEEAWARMPKGDSLEEDSVVWCEEERIAYSACRPLLLEGDQIGARMAFKERYEKEVTEARSQAKPARWTMSAGYNVGHRLTTLAAAVEENRMTVKNALEFVPEERRDEFVRLLPTGDQNKELIGDIQKKATLPGLLGLMAELQRQGAFPEDLKGTSRPTGVTPVDRTPEETRKLRDKAKAQIEFLERSRNGAGGR
jgi:hypothetical protein